MNDNKEPLKVTAEDSRKLVVETDGKEKTFYLNPIRTMWLDVEWATLFVGSSSAHMSMDYETREVQSTDDDRLEAPKPRISGTASLGRSSIAVIGNKETRSKLLHVGIHQYDYEQDAALKKESKLPPAKTAHLFYVEHDWEIGNKAGWELGLYVEQSLMTQLVDAIATKRIKSLKLGIRFNNIYSDDDWAPPSMSADWFTRPDERGSTLVGAPVGYLDSCQIELEQVDLRKKEDAEVDDPSDLEPQPEPVNPNVIALGKLRESVDAIRSTIKWTGGLIFVALLLMLIR